MVVEYADHGGQQVDLNPDPIPQLRELEQVA